MSWFWHSREKEDLLMGKDTEELQARIEKLEKRMRTIEEDWTEVYGKFRTLQMRTAKQVQRLEEDSPPEAPEATGDDGLPNPGNMSSLSPRAQLIQRQILERRRTLTGKGGE